MQKRIEFIDIAKALGILAVMMSHGIGFPFGTGYYFCASFIPLFFVLSGYTYKSGRTFGENIKRKIGRIGVAYFFYSGVLLVLSIGVKFALHEEITLRYLRDAIIGVVYSTNSLYYPHTVKPNITFFIIQNGPLWFLTCFMIGSVLFYAAARFLKSRMGFLLTFLGGVGMTVLLSFLPIRLPWSMDTAFAGMSFMVFGYYLRWEKAFEKCSKWYWAILTVAAYIGLCSLNPGIAMSQREYGPYGIGSIFLFFIIGMAGALCYIIISKLLRHIPLIKAWMVFIGQHTLPILAFHVFIFLCVDTVLSMMGIAYIERGAVYWLVGAFKIVLAIGICCLGSAFWQTGRIKIWERVSKNYNKQ